MKTCITARIEQQRKFIRRTQINHFFLAKREIMMGLNRGDAVLLS